MSNIVAACEVNDTPAFFFRRAPFNCVEIEQGNQPGLNGYRVKLGQVPAIERLYLTATGLDNPAPRGGSQLEQDANGDVWIRVSLADGSGSQQFIVFAV
jgi:hypothetical protein